MNFVDVFVLHHVELSFVALNKHELCRIHLMYFNRVQDFEHVFYSHFRIC